MFERILSLFNGQSAEVTMLPEADAKHAIGALLVRVAKADQVYLFEEIERIDQVLALRYDLNVIEAAKLRAECEVLESSIPETTEIASIVRSAIRADDREATIKALWEVVLADGLRVEVEDELLVKLEGLLGVLPERSKELHDLAAAERNKF